MQCLTDQNLNLEKDLNAKNWLKSVLPVDEEEEIEMANFVVVV